MAEILATKTTLPGNKVRGTFEAIHAEALFASALQPSGSPTSDQVSHAVATTLQQLGVRGCAARLASEFGDHPDTAAVRMSWALATIRAACLAPSITPAPDLLPLAFAS
jgi:hypothetical protein